MLMKFQKHKDQIQHFLAFFENINFEYSLSALCIFAKNK